MVVMDKFKLHPNLAKKTFIIDLQLCRVLLENNSLYPWIFLVPRRANISRIMDLKFEDQLLLLKELEVAQQILWKNFKPEQLNVAAIGNKTPQLHVHVIARRENDPAWPGTVWDHSDAIPYTEKQKERVIEQIKIGFITT